MKGERKMMGVPPASAPKSASENENISQLPSVVRFPMNELAWSCVS